MRRAGDEFGHFEAALDVALGILDGLAVLGAEQGRQLVHVLVDERDEGEEDAPAALRIGRGPAGLRGSGRGDGGFEIGGGGEGRRGPRRRRSRD